MWLLQNCTKTSHLHVYINLKVIRLFNAFEELHSTYKSLSIVGNINALTYYTKTKLTQTHVTSGLLIFVFI